MSNFKGTKTNISPKFVNREQEGGTTKHLEMK